MMRCVVLASLLVSVVSSSIDYSQSGQGEVVYSHNKDEASLIAAKPQVPGAEVFSFAEAVGSGMVLAAAPKRAMIWGFCPPGAKVNVGFEGSTVAATIGPDQATGALTTWRALLPTTAPSFEKHTITATSANTTLTLTDVMFGEVWVCSGQSNMQYPIGSDTCWNASNINCTDTDSSHDRSQCGYGCTQNAGAEIAAMSNYDNGMRLFQVGQSSQPTPQAEMRSSSGWLTPSEMGGKFSSVCWFYGRDVFAQLSPKVPIGLIETNVGGTPDQHWSSPDALKTCVGPDTWDWATNFTDSILWNGMVVPLLRTVHSGAVWYQGENNAAYPRRYNCSFPAMINDWRAKFHKYTDGAAALDFPFGWVQLNSCGTVTNYRDPVFSPNPPPSNCGSGCPDCSTECLGKFHEWGDYSQGFTGIRYAQSNTLRSVSNTFQAVIFDTPVPGGSIHSPFKQAVGQRLARGGLAVAYGMKELHAVDPMVDEVKLTADGLVISLTGLGSGGIKSATIGSVGFEVLGTCSQQNNVVCWKSTPIAAATTTSITLNKTSLPGQPQAVRYLWYIAPYGVFPDLAPVYAKVEPMGTLSGEDQDFLPLGPFVLPL